MRGRHKNFEDQMLWSRDIAKAKLKKKTFVAAAPFISVQKF
jgi:hypothetical protein